ncbi:MAG: nucleotidyltransferase domain-containing protein [Spirochaetales bacterium]|nr:nucleotidyltransferase domain-containing protein [Spirochaetales bacterium]
MFGSRAEGTDHYASDFDVGITGLEEQDLSDLKYAILDQTEESIIPWKVNIVNFDTVSDSFKQTAMTKFILWKTLQA